MSHDLRPRQPPCKKAELEIQNLLQRPAGAGTNFQAQFYPRDKILNFLNREEVEKVLLCKCHNCSEHLGCLSQEEGSNQSPRQYLDNIIPFQGNGQRAVSLFALMIILRYPLLIIPLLSRNYRDASFLDEYHRDTSKDRDTEVPRLKKFFECLGPDEAGALAERFWENVFKFAVPFLHGKDFTIYHANTVLPFLTSERLGGGAFGDVFAFTIYAHYNNLPPPFDRNTTLRYARKTIRPSRPNQSSGANQTTFDTSAYRKEVRNLKLLNDSLSNANIVRIVKPYRVGNELNIIFPCAVANLDRCLRDTKFHLDQICYMPIRESLIWEQMLGVANALHEILTAVNELSDQDQPLLGYHFDLKPANILVEGSKPTEFLFKITDFGLSGFKTPEAGSNTMPYTGDCQYMPPEGRDTVANRKYDVWSLGCILLEVTAFAIRSYDGVELLDKLFPIVKTEHNYAFFRKIDGGAILRPDVVEFMDRELDSFVEESSMHDESDHLFVKNVIDLIKMMLEPSAASRLTSLEVVEHLKLLRSDLGRHTSAEVELVAAYPREIELGGQTLHSLRRLRLKSNEQSTIEQIPAIIQIFEKERSQNLRFVGVPANMPQAIPIPLGYGLRKDLLLIPQYAMDKKYVAGRSDILQLVWASNIEQPALGYDFAGDLEDLRVLQGVLIGHRVHYSRQLVDAEIKTPKPIYNSAKRHIERARHGLGSTAKNQELSPENGPFTIQIWRKEDSKYSEAKLKGLPCHFVIFFAAAIIIIPFNPALRLEHLQESQLLDSSLLQMSIVPMDKRKHSEFDMVKLVSKRKFEREPGSKEFPPAIPLSEEDFKTMMMTTKITHSFNSVTLKFGINQDLLDFRQTYLSLRQHWLEDTPPIE